MSVSKGEWSGDPISYGYQWEECSESESELLKVKPLYVILGEKKSSEIKGLGKKFGGEVCMPIPGATNATYTPTSSEVGQYLRAEVTATNGYGSVLAVSEASGGVRAFSSEITEYALPKGSRPFGMTAESNGDLWFTDYESGNVGEITAFGAITEYADSEDDEPEGITAGPDGNLWFVENGVRHVNHMTTSGELSVYTLTRTDTDNVGITTGADGNLWFTESGTGYIGKISTKDELLGEYELPSGSKPYGITAGPEGDLWFTDYGTSKVGKVTTSGSITEYSLPSGSEPYDIVSGPEGDLWFTDYGTSKIGKVTTSGSITEYALPSGSEPRGIAAGPEDDLYFTDYGTSRIGQITASGTVSEYALPSDSKPQDIASGAEGDLWFTEYGTSEIGKLTLVVEGEDPAPSAGSTIEYDVPVSGEGAPYPMSSTDVKEWGQKAEDAPTEAFEIFPEEHPQGWPATSKTGATVYYMNGEAETVNVASPSEAPGGAISTTECNESGEVVRSLSAKNRERALKESDPVEAAEKLSTEVGTTKKKMGMENCWRRLALNMR